MEDATKKIIDVIAIGWENQSPQSKKLTLCGLRVMDSKSYQNFLVDVCQHLDVAWYRAWNHAEYFRKVLDEGFESGKL